VSLAIVLVPIPPCITRCGLICSVVVLTSSPMRGQSGRESLGG